jgi:hypothetical protein
MQEIQLEISAKEVAYASISRKEPRAAANKGKLTKEINALKRNKKKLEESLLV